MLTVRHQKYVLSFLRSNRFVEPLSHRTEIKLLNISNDCRNYPRLNSNPVSNTIPVPVGSEERDLWVLDSHCFFEVMIRTRHHDEYFRDFFEKKWLDCNTVCCWVLFECLQVLVSLLGPSDFFNLQNRKYPMNFRHTAAKFVFLTKIGSFYFVSSTKIGVFSIFDVIK